MKIIPVIDYRKGNVVLAQLGNRDSYQPVSSALCDKPDINSVIEGILTLAEFKTIYIADLDCIENQQLEESLWPSLCSRYPDIEFWIDLGKLSQRWAQFMANISNARPVIGSESHSSIKSLTLSLSALNNYRPLLSIDIRQSRILGPDQLLSGFDNWPDDVVILSLSHVGSNSGPDYDSIRNVSSHLCSQNIFYGGGTRNEQDIRQLASLNIKGVLVASSLHSEKINKCFLEKVS